MSYSGPPSTSPPPPGWRPPMVIRPAPPRELPPQDLAALATAERHARQVTWAIAGGAGLIALVVACALLGRLIS